MHLLRILIGSVTSVVIGQSNYFGFGFTKTALFIITLLVLLRLLGHLWHNQKKNLTTVFFISVYKSLVSAHISSTLSKERRYNIFFTLICDTVMRIQYGIRYDGFGDLEF